MNKRLLFMYRKTVMLLAFLLIVCSPAKAQLYAVSASSVLNAPYSIYFSDYTAIGSNNYALNIIFNDYNKSSYRVRLKFSIKSNSVSITTTDNYFLTKFITIYPGVNSFTGADLKGYFNVDNMNISADGGESSIRQSKALPEGYYTISVDIYDAQLDKKLSMGTSVGHSLYKNYPPRPILPAQLGIAPSSNMNFRWQSNLNGSFLVSYDLLLVEVPAGMNPVDAIRATTKPIAHVKGINTTNYYYGPDQLPLVPGRQYAWMVHVKDLNGTTTFENYGNSEIYSFFYGYGKGNVQLNLDRLYSSEHWQTKKMTDFVSMSWSPSDFPAGQQITYKAIVTSAGGLFAYDNYIYNFLGINKFNERHLPHSLGSLTSLSIGLPGAGSFDAQVYAYAGDSLTGKSNIISFTTFADFQTFKAGKWLVYVDRIKGMFPDSSKFSGNGHVMIDSIGLVDVTFSDLELRSVPVANDFKKASAANPFGGARYKAEVETQKQKDFKTNRYTLFSGTVIGAIDKKFYFKNGSNGKAYIQSEQVLFDTAALDIKGKIVWELPLATTNANSIPTLSSGQSKIRHFANFAFNDTDATEAKDFSLLDPGNFKLHYDNSSQFMVSNSVLTLKMNGSVTSSASGAVPCAVTFAGADNPFYFTNKLTGNQLTSGIYKPNNLVQITPGTVTFDFSSSQSPGKLSNEANWKGVYLNSYALNASSITFLETLNRGDAWFSTGGLNLQIDTAYRTALKTTTNTFPSAIDSFRISIQDGAMSGAIKGKIGIPILYEFCDYTTPIDNNGLQPGYIDNSCLTDKTLILNPDDVEKKVTVTINQAVLRDSYVDMNVGVNWADMNVTINNLSEFRIWGDGSIGFASKNGSKALTQQVQGIAYDGYAITADSIGVFNIDDKIAVGLSAAIVISDDAVAPSGDGSDSTGGGATKSIFVSTYIFRDRDTTSQRFPPYNDIVGDAANAFADAVVSVCHADGGYFIPFLLPIPGYLTAKGYVQILKNDPIYGNSFKGVLSVSLDKPAPVKLNGEVIVGKVNGYSYWFIQAGFGGRDMTRNSTSLEQTKSTVKGIPIGPITLTGFTGKLYHHMKSESSECIVGSSENEATPRYVPDGTTSYGGGLAIDFMDVQSQGYFLQGQGSLEMAFNNSGGLNMIKFKVATTLGNYQNFIPGVKVVGSACLSTAQGCISYAPPDESFVGTLSAEIGGGCGGCSHGYLNISSSRDSGFAFSLGTETNPIVIVLTGGIPNVCVGATFMGYFNYKQRGQEYHVGLAAGYSLSLASPNICLAGVCASAKVSFGYDIGAYADILDNHITKVGIRLNAYAKLTARVDYIVGTWNGTLAELLISGNVEANFIKKRLTGSVKCRASMCHIGSVTLPFKVGLNF